MKLVVLFVFVLIASGECGNRDRSKSSSKGGYGDMVKNFMSSKLGKQCISAGIQCCESCGVDILEVASNLNGAPGKIIPQLGCLLPCVALKLSIIDKDGCVNKKTVAALCDAGINLTPSNFRNYAQRAADTLGNCIPDDECVKFHSAATCAFSQGLQDFSEG